MYHVQILTGDGSWRDVLIDLIHETLDAALQRITSSVHAPSWMRIVNDAGEVVTAWENGQIAQAPRPTLRDDDQEATLAELRAIEAGEFFLPKPSRR